jgi:hypothetical protein
MLSALALFSSAVMPQEPTKLPYGLSCAQCMIDVTSSCAALPKAELVIDARQMEPIDERRECDSKQTCQVSVGSRFGSVFVLRSPKATASTKIFLSQYTESSGDAPPSGVRLMPDTRYVLFTKRAAWRAPFDAQWHVLAACVVPK